jgi:hypothetical protein
MKTAVEWLIEQMNSQKGMLFECDIKQAKEIEKQQIIDAAKSCNYIGGATDFEAEQYYKETFKQD